MTEPAENESSQPVDGELSVDGELPTAGQRAASGELGFDHAAAKVKTFPQSSGVYLMKDAAGRVIYVGKAKNLRSRASSYFFKAAAEDQRTATWIGEIADIDFIDCESEVDALLMESRLIKDIQPKHNKELKDDKSFPYLMITTREEFPRVEVTREPKDKGVKLYGPVCQCRVPCGARSRSCSGSSSFAPARWTSANRTNVGIGFGLVCWPVSINARRPAIFASAKKTIDAISSVCRRSWKAARNGY